MLPLREFQFDLYGEVVRRSPGPEFPLPAVRVFRTVGVGQDSVAEHSEARRYEEVVDAAEGLDVGVEPVFGARFGIADFGRVVGVGQDAGVAQDRIAPARLAHVEVAREDDPLAAAQLFDLRQYQAAALGLSLFAAVVGVGGEEPEPLTALSVIEPAPCADADVFGVPALAGLRGVFGEPEMARIEQSEAAALVEDRGVFAACGPVVASDADVIVAGQRREHALQLAVEDLLRPEDVEVVEPDQRRDHRETPLPAVALGRVFGVELADVVGRGRETLRRGVDGRHACDGHADQ